MYKVNVDSILEIGSSHSICEDYIIHSEKDSITPWIILSDGCSSSKHTDVGARLLGHIIKKNINKLTVWLKYMKDTKTIYESVHNTINYTINNIDVLHKLELELSCLDCTLLFAIIIKDNCYVFRYGDGSIIKQFKDNTIEINSIKFKQNSPYYLSYELNNNLKMEYFKSIGNTYYEHIENISTNSSTIKENVKFINDQTIEVINLKDIKNILITSDGIESFTNNIKKENVPINNVINDMLDFKNTNGNFLKRRLTNKRGVLNNLKKQNITHYDDLSIGCFNIKQVIKI